MAIRGEDLGPPGPAMYRLPARRLRAAAAHRRAVIRRRVALGSVAAAVAVATLLGGGTAPASRPGAPRAVVLRAGDTLWEIAHDYAPAGVDTRAYVDAVIELNGLSAAPEAGQRLRLPR